MALLYEGLRKRALRGCRAATRTRASKRCAGGGPRGRGSQRASRRRASEASLGAPAGGPPEGLAAEGLRGSTACVLPRGIRLPIGPPRPRRGPRRGSVGGPWIVGGPRGPRGRRLLLGREVPGRDGRRTVLRACVGPPSTPSVRAPAKVRCAALVVPPVLHVDPAAVDGPIEVLRGPLRIHFEKVMEDPRSLGAAHGALRREVREALGDMRIDLELLEGLSPASEVLRRV